MSASYIQEDAASLLSLSRTAVVSLALPWGPAARILLSWPEQKPAAAGHPLLVLLGSEHQFGVARGLAALLADDDTTATEAGILAAIVLDDDGFSLPWDARPGAPSGSALAEVIAAAIEVEMAGRFPVDRSRIGVVGFGAAGRFAVEVAIARPATFSVTIAANPAVWPGGQPPIDADALRDRLDTLAPRQLLLLAGADEAGVRGKRSRMAANARTIAARLADTRVAGLAVTVALVDDDDPVAIVPITISRAIRLAFASRPVPGTPS